MKWCKNSLKRSGVQMIKHLSNLVPKAFEKTINYCNLIFHYCNYTVHVLGIYALCCEQYLTGFL